MGNEIWRGRSGEAVIMEKIWQPGDLFHKFNRAAIDGRGQPADRLDGILSRGLIAPGSDPAGLVVSDHHNNLVSTHAAYEKVVFLYRFNPELPPPYASEADDLAFIFINPNYTVLELQDKRQQQPPLAKDEVYVPGYIEPKDFAALALPESRIDRAFNLYRTEIDQLNLSVFDLTGRRYI